MTHPQQRRGICLSVLGTGSDVGKSITVAALLRIFKRRGFNTAPFKAQNMSNNSYVTGEGGEMGRAQVVQAEAAGLLPHVDMNPVLLKPCTDTGSQVVLNGHAIGNREARAYFTNNRPLFEAALESLDRLRRQHDLIIVEGAGSCAEVNLRRRDFVNFETAHAADAPVILVADIDRGGVFAQIIGTLAVIPKRDKERVKGFIINRFRGDISLFEDGVAYLQEKTGLPVLGVIPYYRHIDIDAEDGLPLDVVIDPQGSLPFGEIHIAVIRLPHISNFTDFAPLSREGDVALHYLSRPADLAGYDDVILPGTKNVRSDLAWLRQVGWDKRLLERARQRGRITGICGGYQIMGNEIADPEGYEGHPGVSPGLGLLDTTTTLQKTKQLYQVEGIWSRGGLPVSGYEIHMGRTDLGPTAKPVITITQRNCRPTEIHDGASDNSGRIFGTYLHGLFDSAPYRERYLGVLNPGRRRERSIADITAFKNEQYDLLATHFESHLDMERLIDIIKGHWERPCAALSPA